MEDTDFEAELARLNKTNGVISKVWEILTLVGALIMYLFASSVRAAIWFAVVGVAAGAVAWLLGSSDPREVAIFWGWVSTPFAFVWTGMLWAKALSDARYEEKMKKIRRGLR